MAQSDNLVDAISLASLRSKGELIVVADKGCDILREVQHSGGPVLLKGLYDSVPILGRPQDREIENLYEELGSWLVPQIELQLEMNLAVMYTVIMHIKNQPVFVEPRGQLVGSAHDKLVQEGMLGKMQFAQRFGAIRYLDASSFALGGHESVQDDDVSWHYEAGIEFLVRAKDIAQSYSAYHQFIVVFNLGRMEFLRGENRDLAREYLQQARSISEQAGNSIFPTLVQHYLNAIEDDAQFGTVIEDPSKYKDSLMELVISELKPEEKKLRMLDIPKRVFFR